MEKKEREEMRQKTRLKIGAEYRGNEKGRLERMEIEEEKRKEERGNLYSRIKGLDEKIEGNERKERRKNIVIKGIEVKKGRGRKAVEELMKRIGAK